MTQNQRIALEAKELRLPETWNDIETQNELLRDMRAAPSGEPPEGSIEDLIQKAANAIVIEDYDHLATRPV